MILLIDNYDSFTFNLYQLCASLVDAVHVVRNDKISVKEVFDLQPDAIILSPGPKSPYEAGICIELIQSFAATVPILGVCLGMQAIGVAFGANMIRAPFPMHGKSSAVVHSGQQLFQDIPNPMIVGRYHSLLLEKSSLPSVLVEEATTDDGLIMALRHRDYPCFGVQFHPESILTENGDRLVSNFFKLL